VAAVCSAQRANCAAAREALLRAPRRTSIDPSARREGPFVELRDRWEGRWFRVPGLSSGRALCQSAEGSAAARARRHRGDQRQRETSQVPQLRPLRLPRAPGAPWTLA